MVAGALLIYLGSNTLFGVIDRLTIKLSINGVVTHFIYLFMILISCGFIAVLYALSSVRHKANKLIYCLCNTNKIPMKTIAIPRLFISVGFSLNKKIDNRSENIMDRAVIGI